MKYIYIVIFLNSINTFGQLVLPPLISYKATIQMDGLNRVTEIATVTDTQKLCYDAVGNITCFNNKANLNPLPLTLLEFSAKKYNTNPNQSLLTWVTTSEFNIYGFEIEYSTDARVYKKIGLVEGKNLFEQVNNYNFLHSNPILGDNYYRLKIIDIDNSFDYSPVQRLNFEDLVGKYIIYPNPTKNILNIDFQEPTTHPIINIYNQSGQLLGEDLYDVKTISDWKVIININQIPSGNYIISIVSGDNHFVEQVNITN